MDIILLPFVGFEDSSAIVLQWTVKWVQLPPELLPEAQELLSEAV
jgi:hypothetical protein